MFPIRAKTLTWDAPTTYVDGTPLGNDLAGYKLYCNSAPKQKGFPQDLPLGGTITGAKPTYRLWIWPGERRWCAVTAYAVNGKESEKSNEIGVDWF